MKRCSKCKEDKELVCFSKQKSARDGFQYNCKECKKKQSERRYAENPNYNKESYLRVITKNPHHCKEVYQRRIEKNPNYSMDSYYKSLKKDPEFGRKAYKSKLKRNPNYGRYEYQKKLSRKSADQFFQITAAISDLTKIK